ncbi:MAG TPA: hypothetical protein VLA99_14085 [Nitrospiraceae bacterium]|nr:hypothetical protein [Nitrospiraceae bacterium]
MELVMWILVGMLASAGFIVLVPVLVLGTWFVVMTAILGLADGAIWLLDQGWKKNARRPLLLAGVPRGDGDGEIDGQSDAVGLHTTAQRAA